MCFNWVEDAAAMPIEPLCMQDLSGLKMGCKQLFGVLQRRTRQRQAPMPFFLGLRTLSHSLPSSQAYRYYPQPFITQQHPSGIGPGKPTVTIPFGEVPASTPPVLKLDWDQDPCLANLSKALQALGWTPPW